jgi:hypothetical protein
MSARLHGVVCQNIYHSNSHSENTRFLVFIKVLCILEKNAWVEGCSEIYTFVFVCFYCLVNVIKVRGSLLVETSNIKLNLKM